jgi:Domain of Unknown Function (DUF1080)
MSGDKQRFHIPVRLFIGIICLLLIIGSSIILLVLHNAPGQNSSATPPQSSAQSTHAPTHTPVPTTTGTAGITPSPTPFFEDNFLDNSQGWYMSNVVGYKRSLTSDGLMLTNTNTNPMIESLPTNHKFDDFTMTTTLTLQQGDKNDSVGVYLRGDSNLDHDYRIDIFGNTMYAISKEYLNTENAPQILYLVPPSHAFSLKPRGEANTLTIIMKGPTMILFINEELVNVIIDEDYTRGQIALFVAHGVTSGNVTALFSSIEIDPAPDQFPFISACPITPTSTAGSDTPTSIKNITPTSTEGITPTVCNYSSGPS